MIGGGISKHEADVCAFMDTLIFRPSDINIRIFCLLFLEV